MVWCVWGGHTLCGALDTLPYCTTTCTVFGYNQPLHKLGLGCTMWGVIFKVILKKEWNFYHLWILRYFSFKLFPFLYSKLGGAVSFSILKNKEIGQLPVTSYQFSSYHAKVLLIKLWPLINSYNKSLYKHYSGVLHSIVSTLFTITIYHSI